MDSNQKSMKLERVASELKAAFPLRPVPSEYRRDRETINYEVKEDIEMLLGRSWDQITLSEWSRLMSPAAIRESTSPEFFRYYLPSLLVAVLADFDFVRLALDALLPHNQRRLPRAEWKEFRQSLNDIQVEAIISFLEVLKEFSDPNGSDWFEADAGLSGLWN